MQSPFVINSQNQDQNFTKFDSDKKQKQPQKINAHFTRTISEPFEFRESNKYSKTDALIKISETDSMGNYFDQMWIILIKFLIANLTT